MKKRFLFLLLAIGLTSNSAADYLDDWPDEALCGWMDNPSPPSYMVEEVKKRGISCSFGVVLTETVDVNIPLPELDAVVPGYISKEFTPETWLSNFGLKPEDLSPMLLELSKKTQATVPVCKDLHGARHGSEVWNDFCFTMQPEVVSVKDGHFIYVDGVQVWIPEVTEILNTGQLLQSLLFWDPNALDPNLTHKWEGPDKVIVKEYVENIYELHPWKNPECYVAEEERGPEFVNKCAIMPFHSPFPAPPIVQPPLEPTPPVPIRPGWKIAEGSNFWSIDEADPYWQTDEGSAELEAAKDRGSWIETEASRYAQENPGVDAPIPSYYATDSCGEGKQPDNASC